MTAILVTCPLCGGAVTPWGWTAAGNRHGQCAHCYTAVIITVHPQHAPRGQINKDAPFYPLVELIDSLNHTDPKQRWVASTGSPRGEIRTIDA